jgi:hypothetical protein
MWLTLRLWPSPDRLVAVVEVAGQEVLQFDVPGPGDEEPKHYRLVIPRGEATIEAAAGRVRILPLPSQVCPLGICWSTGWIGRAGQTIVCLPNRIVIRLRGRAPGVDGITY